MKRIERWLVRTEKSLEGLLGAYRKEIDVLNGQLNKVKDQLESLQIELEDKEEEEIALLHSRYEEKEEQLEQMQVDLADVHLDYWLVKRVLSLPSKEDSYYRNH